jgi:hypothetical protein
MNFGAGQTVPESSISPNNRCYKTLSFNRSLSISNNGFYSFRNQRLTSLRELGFAKAKKDD